MTDLTNKVGAATPEEAAQQFSKCLLSGDYKGALAICIVKEISEEEAIKNMETLTDIYQNVLGKTDIDIEIEDATIEGDEAEVSASFITKGKKQPMDFLAVKIDGRWFVDMEF